MTVRNEKYGPEVREAAFWVWLTEADRDGARTARLLREAEDRLALLDGRDPVRTPVSDTICRWAGIDDWHGRAHAELAEHDELWHIRQIGRLKVLNDHAIAKVFAIVTGECDHLPPAIVNAVIATYRHNSELLGLGTFSRQPGRPEIPPPVEPARLTAGRTPMELAAENAARALDMDYEDVLQRALSEREIPEAKIRKP